MDVTIDSSLLEQVLRTIDQTICVSDLRPTLRMPVDELRQAVSRARQTRRRMTDAEVMVCSGCGVPVNRCAECGQDTATAVQPEDPTAISEPVTADWFIDNLGADAGREDLGEPTTANSEPTTVAEPGDEGCTCNACNRIRERQRARDAQRDFSEDLLTAVRAARRGPTVPTYTID